MFHCNPLFIRCELICSSSKAASILRVFAKICQLGKKLVVDREIAVSIKLIGHSMPLCKIMSFFIPFFFFLRIKRFLLLDLAGKIKIDFPQIQSFQGRSSLNLNPAFSSFDRNVWDS